jgi:MoaA/NifB/PqqE/SkfB family radical SAM enzyme
MAPAYPHLCHDARVPLAAEDSHATKGLIRLTMVCNERCPFCNVPMEDFPSQPTPSDAIAQMLDRFAAAGDRTVTISGGEPTLLRRRLLETLRATRARGIPFAELQTNAILIDDHYAEQLAQAGLTSAFVSFLSQDPAHHDALAGLQGAWPRTLAGIDALLDAGIRVALNVVVAHRTQALLDGFVAFVAHRLPRVRTISLSAVQPHGRARADPSLMPDYAVLGPQVLLARKTAQRHGITLLNPYCGLPACVGWQDDLDHSVEAIESRLDGAGPRGLDQAGNKSHGRPCTRCALRPRCGGAWHAYWQVRAGSGLRPPAQVLPPWEGNCARQTVVDGRNQPLPWADLRRAETQTVWLWTDRLSAAQAAGLRQAGCTHLALECSLGRSLAILAALPDPPLPQDRIFAWVTWQLKDPAALMAGIQELVQAGATGVAVRTDDPVVRTRLDRLGSMKLQVEVTWRAL